ncbi:MAG: GTP-binding protein, partial [bacterium]
MKEFHPENIRNITFIGHQGSGKTTLIEAILYRLGSITRMGSVEEGNTQSDYRADEVARRMSIATTILVAEEKGLKLNLIDTPGFTDFQGEVLCGLKACDSAIMVINATGGIEVGTDIFYDLTLIENRPLAFFINQLDKEHTDFDKVYKALEEEFQKTAPLQYPLNAGSSHFSDIVDLLHMKLYTTQQDGACKVSDIPQDLIPKISPWRTKLIERIAEVDDALMETYFANESLSTEEMLQGLKLGLMRRTIFPVLCGAGKIQVGVQQLIA